MKPGHTGVKRIVVATINSWKGLQAAWKYEAAFRENTALALVLLLASFWLAQGLTQWLLLIMPLFLLLIVELLNSAVETTVDRIGPEFHELSGRAKDLGSAAVFMCHIMIATAWLSTIWVRFSA
jgi:diacylglycerol kinase (ATP)